MFEQEMGGGKKGLFLHKCNTRTNAPIKRKPSYDEDDDGLTPKERKKKKGDAPENPGLMEE